MAGDIVRQMAGVALLQGGGPPLRALWPGEEPRCSRDSPEGPPPGEDPRWSRHMPEGQLPWGERALGQRSGYFL